MTYPVLLAPVAPTIIPGILGKDQFRFEKDRRTPPSELRSSDNHLLVDAILLAAVYNSSRVYQRTSLVRYLKDREFSILNLEDPDYLRWCNTLRASSPEGIVAAIFENLRPQKAIGRGYVYDEERKLWGRPYHPKKKVLMEPLPFDEYLMLVDKENP